MKCVSSVSQISIRKRGSVICIKNAVSCLLGQMNFFSSTQTEDMSKFKPAGEGDQVLICYIEISACNLHACLFQNFLRLHGGKKSIRFCNKEFLAYFFFKFLKQEIHFIKLYLCVGFTTISHESHYINHC